MVATLKLGLLSFTRSQAAFSAKTLLAQYAVEPSPIFACFYVTAFQSFFAVGITCSSTSCEIEDSYERRGDDDTLDLRCVLLNGLSY